MKVIFLYILCIRLFFIFFLGTAVGHSKHVCRVSDRGWGMGGGKVPDGLMPTRVTMAVAAVLLFLIACLRWFPLGSGCDKYMRLHSSSSTRKNCCCFRKTRSECETNNREQKNHKSVTYLFKLATVSEAPHAPPSEHLQQPMRARCTWRPFFAMTSSLLWDDVKFKMDGITTSAEKPLQQARKVAAVW